MAPGPLLEGLETRLTDHIPVTRFMLFEQAVADQQRDTTLADLDRRDHDHASRAALSEASYTCGGCWCVGHVTNCYYDINIDLLHAIIGVRIVSLHPRQTLTRPIADVVPVRGCL